MRTDSHANCVCMGGDFMPTDEDTVCGCLMASCIPEDEWIVQEGCTHPTATFDLVCRTHLKHEPCRHCMREEGVLH